MTMSLSRARSASLTLIACLAATALVVAPAEARKAGKGKQPNVVVIMTDDQNLDDLDKMPNTQKLLVKQGTNFKNAVTSFPLCCPGRATFITGQYAHNNGVVGNFYPYGWYGMPNRENILPAWLQRSGYRTGMVGKWLNGYGAKNLKGEKPKGFDVWRGLLDVSAYDYYNFVMSIDGKKEKVWGDKTFARKLVQFGQIQTIPREEPVIRTVFQRLTELFGPGPYGPEDWGTEKNSDYTVDVTGKVFTDLLAAEKGQKKPFFMWWSPAAPHREDVATTLMGRPGADPRPPKRYVAKSKSYRLPKPPSFNQAQDSFSKLPTNIRDNPVLRNPMTDAQVADLEENYQGRMGSLLAVDDHVKNIVSTLKKTGQYKNTMFVFTSDNGWLNGEHRIPGDKYLPYEESLKTPFVIAGPGVPKGRTVEGQVSNVDFAATILDATGAKAGRTQDGISLLPVANDPSKLPDRALLVEAPEPLFASPSMPQQWDQPYRGVRTSNWKFVVWNKTGEEELYDLKNDPYEINNIAADPAYAAVKAGLAAKLEQLNKCAGAACSAVPAG